MARAERRRKARKNLGRNDTVHSVRNHTRKGQLCDCVVRSPSLSQKARARQSWGSRPCAAEDGCATQSKALTAENAEVSQSARRKNRHRRTQDQSGKSVAIFLAEARFFLGKKPGATRDANGRLGPTNFGCSRHCTGEGACAT